MSIHPKSLFKLFTCLLFTTSVHAITVTDFLGNKISLQKPAKRIIALAPHIVENMFSAGGGDSITGTVRYSDYPEAAKSIPQLGSMGSFGLESIVNLDPDLVIIWHSGSGSEMYSKIKELGIPIYASAPRKISDIAKSIRDYGHLTGNSSTAEVAAIQFEKKYKKLVSLSSPLTTIALSVRSYSFVVEKTYLENLLHWYPNYRLNLLLPKTRRQ